MATLTPARRVAYQAFFECRRNNLRIRDYLRESKDFSELSVQDKAFATRLALGATLTKGKLDEALKNRLVSKYKTSNTAIRRASCTFGSR